MFLKNIINYYLLNINYIKLIFIYNNKKNENYFNKKWKN